MTRKDAARLYLGFLFLLLCIWGWPVFPAFMLLFAAVLTVPLAIWVTLND